MGFLDKIFGNYSQKELKRIDPIVQEVLSLEETYRAMSEEELKNQTAILKGRLANGEKHDDRAPDYDDWSLNGDILVYNRVTNASFEISSMGIRVDKATLLAQLKAENVEDRLNLPFHKALVNGELPFTIGGGIGQSRLCMLLLQKAHIGEVHSSVWPQSELDYCEQNGITLL